MRKLCRLHSIRVLGQDRSRNLPFRYRLHDLLLRLRPVRSTTLLVQEIGQDRKGRSLGMNPLIILRLQLYQKGIFWDRNRAWMPSSKIPLFQIPPPGATTQLLGLRQLSTKIACLSPLTLLCLQHQLVRNPKSGRHCHWSVLWKKSTPSSSRLTRCWRWVNGN